MIKKRILWADSLKGWLIILVIIGHAIQVLMGNACENNHVWNLIYSFHMPAFMAVSGWFAFKRPHGRIISACKRRCYQVLVPYLVWSSLQWLISGCVLANLPLLITAPDTYFWFLWVIFWICIIFISCQWIADKYRIDELILVGLTCVLLIGIMVRFEFRLFGFQFLSYYFLFYTLGYCIHRFEKIRLKNNCVIITFVILWTFLAWFWNMHELPSCLSSIPYIPYALLQYAYRGFTAMVGVMILFGIAPKVLDNNTKFNNFIKNVGVFSLGLYVVHLMIIGYLKEFLFILAPNCSTWGAITLLSILTFILSVIMVELMNKNKWSARFLLGKL